jgi:hypothetical protein
MRSSCLDCSRKHLSQALVLMLEVPQGYPLHGWIAVGHMAEAADEMIDEYPALAERIREERLGYMSGLNSAMYMENEEIKINYDKLYKASIIDIIYDISLQEMLQSGNLVDDNLENISYEEDKRN